MSSADAPAGASAASMAQAADWFALLRSGEASATDRQGWQAWLDADSANRSAWALMERVGQRFAPIQTSGDPRAAVAILRSAGPSPTRRRALLFGIGWGSAGLLGWTAWRHTPAPALAAAWIADHHAGLTTQRQVALSDGTRVWLAPGSAFDQVGSHDGQGLRLVAGQIFVETASQAVRPLVVDTPQGRLQARVPPSGTRFDLRLDGADFSSLAVYAGAVQLRTAAGGQQAQIHQGAQVRFTAEAIGPPMATHPAREAWTRGLLIAEDMRLDDALAELARYRHGHLRAAPAVAGLRVYGSFPLHDTERALAMLAAVLPIRVRRPVPWWCTVDAA